MRRAPIALVCLSIVVLLLSNNRVLAQWPYNGRQVSGAAFVQRFPAIAPDGTGGAIITWQDRRTALHEDIYAQRVNGAGSPMWTADGVPVCTFPNDQLRPAISSDGNKGAIILWSDFRNGFDYDIFGQRLDSLGVAQWTANGAGVGGGIASGQFNPVIASDGADGALFVTEDWRAGNGDVYAQRVNGSGAPQWAGSFGVAICTAAGTQNLIRMVPDNTGGIVIAWQDPRSGTSNDIYAQRIASNGLVGWAANGFPVVTQGSEQNAPAIAPDGLGGAIITWMDFRNGGYDIYAQRINAMGGNLWAADGIAVVTALTGQTYPAIVSDGVNGAIIAWQDNRNDNGDIYAQHVTAGGSISWAADGIPICSATDIQSDVVMVRDNSNGAIIAWRDRRNGNYDVFAQRVNIGGVVQWSANGIPLCTASGATSDLVAIADGANGIVTAWTDPRNGPVDIYAMRARSTLTAVDDRSPGVPGLALRNYPNPFTGSTAVELELSHAADVTIDVFDASGRRVGSRALGVRAAGVHQYVFDGRDDSGRELPSGVYFFRTSANGAVATKKMVLLK